jgi:hypothetical protein
MITNAMVAAEVKPIKMHVSQECYLSNTNPFEQVYENSLFKITVEDEALLGSHTTIKEISLWSDGKMYPIKASEERIYKDNTIKLIRKNNELFADELNAISNAKFVKLYVKYQDNVNEEQSSNGRSPYFTTVKTTIARDQYFPIILPQVEINAAFAKCTETYNEQKNRQSLQETLIVVSGLLGIAGIIVIIIWFRRGRKK